MSFLGGLVGGIGGLLTGNPAALAGGLISGVTGLFQKKKGNDILRNNPRPNYTVPQEVLANQAQAQQMANEGLPSQQYSNAMKNIQRQQTSALANAQDRRLGGALIGGIQQRSNDAAGNVDVADAEARRQNQMNLQNVNNQVGSYRDKMWDYNQRQKYEQQYQYGMGLVGMGNSNLYGGIDRVASGLIGGIGNVGQRGQNDSSSGLQYASSPGLADTGGGVPSPAGQFGGYIDPNSYRGGII